MTHSNNSKIKRYALVGTGGRALMFLDPIASTYKEHAKLVGLCDTNSVRLAFHKARLANEFGVEDVPVYLASEFDRMLKEQEPDVVIVCTVDAYHDEYIVRSLEAGCDVITEKPLTTDEIKCQRIFDAAERTGKSVRVTFNLRWMPAATKVKDLISKGVVGNVKSVVLEYMLNTSHGADYFRRWHSQKAQSGGLLVHKSTHHFDLVNWWVNSIPETVFAFGSLAYYGRKNALQHGKEEFTQYERTTWEAPESDPFRLDLEAEPLLKGLYLDAEKEDSYIRDRNVFRDGIDIEDSMGVLVRYRNGVTLTYSLTAFCPYEGFRVTINGDKGRIEYVTCFNTSLLPIDNGAKPKECQKITVMPLFESFYEVEMPEMSGAHGGGDALLQERLFGITQPADAFGRDAGHQQGAASAVIGFAANHSIESGAPVNIATFLPINLSAVNLSELV